MQLFESYLKIQLNCGEGQLYQDIDKASDSWRWTHLDRASQEVKKLSKKVAASIWERGVNFVGKNTECRPREDWFEITHARNVSDDSSADVKQWLSGLPDENLPIILSFEPSHAELTNWQFFTDYWDDFCFPVQRDVSIWTFTERWILNYWHEEVFYFAKRKTCFN
jgi:hypothetical protein